MIVRVTYWHRDTAVTAQPPWGTLRAYVEWLALSLGAMCPYEKVLAP